jgi:hypothetical protein
MPGYRIKPRPLSQKQKEAQLKKKIAAASRMNPCGLHPRRHSTAEELNDFLVNYNACLINIDIKYPLGHKDRPEWIEVHRKNGVKRILQIVGLTAEEPPP